MEPEMKNKTARESAANLVAIIVAARRARDRKIERDARRKLQERFGVKLTFASELEKGADNE
jgi:hypothetical protein